MSWYWITRATTEGVRWLDELLKPEHGNPEVATWAYFIRGFLAVLQSDSTAARPALQHAVTAARETRQVLALSHSLSMSSIAESMAGDPGSARRFHDEAAEVTSGLDDVTARVGLLQARALNGFFEGDLEVVKTASSEGARLSRETGDLYSLEMMLMNLGLTALFAGDLDDSKSLFVEALGIAHQIDDRVAQYALLDALGYHAARSGQARLGAQLLGAAETVRTGAGASVIAFLVPFLDQAEESASETLGPSRFEAELNAGKSLSRAAAIGLALGKPVRVVATAANEEGEALLGKRQAEVARLVADGLSNKQIGARLFISERTVDSHVRSILNKLGFNSRAQIAAWSASPNQ